MLRKSNWSGNGDVSVNEEWARRTVWGRMLAAAPQPDHSPDGTVTDYGTKSAPAADGGEVEPDDAILARAWYHAGEDGDYNIYDALNADCPDCVEVLIVLADAARLRSNGGDA